MFCQTSGLITKERWAAMKSNSLDNKNILIVGGAGFVGSNLCHHILNNFNPSKVLIVDNLLSSDVSNIPIDTKS